MSGTPESVGFAPVYDRNARVLVLGSLPSVKSLEVQQYYAHPRNQFWMIMGVLFSAGPDISYQDRVKILMVKGVAVWDVLRSSVRPGSLDASIDEETARPNDFPWLFRECRGIRTVFFNGRKSEALFQQLNCDDFDGRENDLSYVSLPSTSPAHAAMSLEEKLIRWTEVKEVIHNQPK
jgi:TDG/mug DNA glycosylase family protein